jgi:predicted Rossmann fold nucleotide-binding protein DprA/Smf involved in DNA uptake
MSYLEQLSESIDARLVELKNEITALDTARTALGNDGAASPAQDNDGAARTAQGNDGAGRQASTETPAPRGQPSRRRQSAKPVRSKRPTQVLLSGKLELMLRESETGLSATTIAQRANARYAQVLDLLRELERSGQVRRLGERRTSRWRLLSDEERIAERAAELAKLSRRSGS